MSNQATNDREQTVPPMAQVRSTGPDSNCSALGYSIAGPSYSISESLTDLTLVRISGTEAEPPINPFAETDYVERPERLRDPVLLSDVFDDQVRFRVIGSRGDFVTLLLGSQPTVVDLTGSIGELMLIADQQIPLGSVAPNGLLQRFVPLPTAGPGDVVFAQVVTRNVLEIPTTRRMSNSVAIVGPPE